MSKLLKIITFIVLAALLSVNVYAASDVPSFKVEYLGIMGEYSGGVFMADEPVTRAEMVKIIVAALGMSTMGEAETDTNFTDVPSDYWASGYIRIAYESGIVNGNGDNIFSPDKNITYAEAVKMIVCALGYRPKAETMGNYPAGYLMVASQLGLVKGLNFINDTPATRGDIARMIDIALDTPIMEQTTFRADGGEVEYQIANGKDGIPLKTLLTVMWGIPNALFQYFDAFANADYETMKQYATAEHIEACFHEGDVFGDKWAKLTGADRNMIPAMPDNALNDDECAFLVDVEMETVPTSALYPETQTSFYVILKNENGVWKVSGFATGL